ncbi:hypothetical protein BKA65DRAFT_400445 [Rhexocercosporidium sp. MPI-PUGE-AT-0058]|nr:hypothetical protein BKA65DRAFT_400445 [Rhexocercosporidium sp. MPI-PUGE-AT-0058]
MGSSASKATKAASKLPSAATATNTARKYPARTPATNSSTQPRNTREAPEEKLGPTVHPDTSARETRDGAITADSSDPDLALNARLKTLGPVQPNPTQSNSSTFHSHSTSTSSFNDPSLSATQFRASRSNPLQTIFPSSSNSNTDSTVSLLTARYRLASEAEDEFAQTGKSTAAKGRQFLDVLTLRQILVLRDEKGVEAGEIERMLGLRGGLWRGWGGGVLLG